MGIHWVLSLQWTLQSGDFWPRTATFCQIRAKIPTLQGSLQAQYSMDPHDQQPWVQSFSENFIYRLENQHILETPPSAT